MPSETDIAVVIDDWSDDWRIELTQEERHDLIRKIQYEFCGG